MVLWGYTVAAWSPPCAYCRVGPADGARGGPGSLFREEWNSMAVKTQKKAISLYRCHKQPSLKPGYSFLGANLTDLACVVSCRSERDVNPTPVATVHTFYNSHESHDLATQMKKKGNTVSALRSATPRFHDVQETKGPGAYSPERVSQLASRFPKTSCGACMNCCLSC